MPFSWTPVFDVGHEFVSNAKVRLEHTGKIGRDHVAFFAGSTTLFAHVSAFHHEGHASWGIILAESFSEHFHHFLHQTFLNLQLGGTIIDDTADFGKTKDAAVLIGDVGKPIFTEESATMMLANGIKRPVVDDHVVINDSILSIREGGDDGLLGWVVAAEHLFEHPQHAVRSGFQSLSGGIVAYVFQKFLDIFLGLFFSNHY